nr:Protein T19D12.1 [Haemonchus contortus]
MHMKRPEPWSLLVFLVGVSIGTVGTILAIVFGIESGKVQQCVCNGANVELFSVKTAIQPNFMSWDERFSNTSSPQYEAAVRNISKALTAALMPSGTNKALTLSSFSEGTMASVQVAQLRRGMNNLIISFAYGVVYGDETTASLPSYDDIQSQLDRDTSIVNSATVASVSSQNTNPCSYQQLTTSSPVTIHHSTPSGNTTSPLMTTIERERKYEGDLAIAFELTTNTNYADVESFVTTLLTYKGNPYSFSPDGSSQEAPSAYILVPYPNTIFYNPQNTYGKLRESDLNVSLSAFNVLLSLQPQTDATMNQAFDFIRSAKDGSNVRTVILVGVSDTFVQSAQQSAQGLVEEGYSIFTVSIGVANFSSLATNKSFVYELVSPSSSVEASLIASEIGTTLLQKSSTCVYAPQSTTVTPTPSSRTTDNHVYSSTTSPCKTPFIQQDIAFVVEISTSTGNLGASHAASNFITNYLIQQKVFDDVYSNFAIVPFPNASSYILGGGIQDFGQLLVEDFVPAFQMIFAVYPITNGAVSDIESGLRYTNDSEFPRLHDDYPRTILLFANSDDGVEAALKISSELKAQTVNILTVSMSDTDDINLQALSSAPDYNWNLPVSDASSYLSMAEVISSKLLELGSVCNDHG